MDRGAKLNYISGTRLFLAIMKKQHEMAELLLEKGIMSSSRQKLVEHLVQTDERMRKKILENNWQLELVHPSFKLFRQQSKNFFSAH